MVSAVGALGEGDAGAGGGECGSAEGDRRYRQALTLRGEAAHGEALFGAHCATCHRVGSAKVGDDIGPNLLTVRDWPTENLLTALLDPDRNVEHRFVAYTADLTDGTTLTGLLTGESAGNVIVKTRIIRSPGRD